MNNTIPLMTQETETLQEVVVPREASNRYGSVNLCVLTAQFAGWALLLSALQWNLPLWSKAAILVLFCLMMQGVFSFMHECFHNMGHPNPIINWILGVLASMMFGASYTLFEVNHEGHHIRNRTRAELVDYIFPDEAPVRKITSYYSAILGGIWLVGFLGSLVLPLLPFSSVKWLSRDGRDNTYAMAFMYFKKSDWWRMRGETLFEIALWLAAFRLLGWHWKPVALAYAAFAFSWSSLQWIYHVGTPLHPVEGAYNLRLPTPIRWLFLNFNYNLTHHRNPRIRWQQLYTESNQVETQPLWYRYLRVFYWPIPLPADPSSIQKRYF